jgi:tetratricopeptide (TPR) repeat protein
MAKVYISSTVTDLETERRATMDWLLQAGHQPVHSYRPDSETVRESCLDDIDGCNLYVLILGHRYGFQPEDNNPDKLSITHLEFRRAGQSHIPRLALIRTSVPDIRLSDLLDPQKAPLVRSFEEEVRREVRPAEFMDLKGLIQGLSTGVMNELEKLRAPSGEHQTVVWLAAQLQDIAKKFASHMVGLDIGQGARPEGCYLDLAVAERHPKKAESEDQRGIQNTLSLEEVLAHIQSPVLLIGEGGSGKTTSLLYAAVQAAERANVDQAVAVPIYVNLKRLTKIEDVPDLLQLIADSVPIVKDWKELSDLGITDSRRFLFLFDSFNEMPEKLQRPCAEVLQRFVEKQKERHTCLIGSRPVPYIEQLARSPSQFRTFEILRLTSEQVQDFLQELGLASLHEKMSVELRELAGNPFMLLAIARTLAGAPQDMLPRNRGKLYQSFVRGWMDSERKKRGLDYSYERVKEPLLSYLANRMTCGGQTSLAWEDDLEAEVEGQLEEINKLIKRRGGMPVDWTVDSCLDEIFGDGLLKRTHDQLHFMHQSVQEYFTGLWYRSPDFLPEALVEFTPKLSWELVPTNELIKAPDHRFVPPLLMMAGLLDDSTKIVEGLARRNPILAAAALSSANRIDNSLVASLEESWLDLLKHDDLRHRVVGCSCLALASRTNQRAVQNLCELAFATEYVESSVGRSALKMLDAKDAVAIEIVERALNLSDDEYEKRASRIEEAVRQLQSARMVLALFEGWRSVPPDSTVRLRFEGLLATVDKSLREQALQTIQPDAAVADDVERALAKAAIAPGSQMLLRTLHLVSTRHNTLKVEAVTRLKDAGEEELAMSLRSSDGAELAAAAEVVAQRRVPIGDVILQQLLRRDIGWGWRELITAVVSLWGRGTAVSKLGEQLHERCHYVGQLSAELTAQLKPGKLSSATQAELKRLGVRSEDMSVEEVKTDGGTSIWLLSPSSWSGYRPRYELRGSRSSLELYDCNGPYRASGAIAKILGEASLAELQHAVQDENPKVRQIAIEALASRNDQGLGPKLIAQLNSKTTNDFVHTALEALGDLQTREAVSLAKDLFVITDDELCDVHPLWGPSNQNRRWSDSIHRTLVRLNTDGPILQILDEALVSEERGPKVAALRELSKWFAEAALSEDRKAALRNLNRLERLLDFALCDREETVRTLAAQALGNVDSKLVQQRLTKELRDGKPAIRANAARALGFQKQEGSFDCLADALADAAIEVQLAAGEALVHLEAHDRYGRVAETMFAIAQVSQSKDFRQRAAAVLKSIPGGFELFYHPIQLDFARGEAEHTLKLIQDTLDIIPEDVNLFWWRGHVLRLLGRLQQAADSYQHASELDKWSPAITHALAETLLELHDYPRAKEAASRAVEIAPGVADARSLLAWSCYKEGAIPDAIEAARIAVDLDPVHSDAIWIVLLGHIRNANLAESHSAFNHAQRVWQLLAPGLDISFLTTFLKELEDIKTDNGEISQLVTEIKASIASERQE